MKVAALIPAYNEEKGIEATLSAVKRIKTLDKIVVINDGSVDDTAAIVLQNPGVSLLSLPRNSGKGAALNFGWRRTEADVYLLLDADLGESAYHAQRLLTPVLLKEVDMTVACFDSCQVSGPGQMGFGLVRGLAAFGIQFLTGRRVASPLSGQRAVTAHVLRSLGGFFPGFGVEIGLTVGVIKKGFQFQEIALPLKHRAYGRGVRGIVHRGGQLIDVIEALWRCWCKGRDWK